MPQCTMSMKTANSRLRETTGQTAWVLQKINHKEEKQWKSDPIG